MSAFRNNKGALVMVMVCLSFSGLCLLVAKISSFFLGMSAPLMLRFYGGAYVTRLYICMSVLNLNVIIFNNVVSSSLSILMNYKGKKTCIS